MRSFKDSKGRNWEIDINLSAIDRLREQTRDLQEEPIDILDATEEGKHLFRRLADPRLLVNVLYLLCEDQAKAEGVDDVEFGRGMKGDSIDDATDALLQGIIDFFPSRQRRPMQKAYQKMQAALEKADQAMDQMIEARMDSMLETTLQRATDQMQKKLDDFAGSSPASSASTPADSLSGNLTE